MEISESTFMNSVQFEYDTTDKTIHLPLRIAYRDNDNMFFATEFVLTVKGPEKESPCAGITLDVVSTAKANYQFSFPAAKDDIDEWKSFDINNALRTSLTDASITAAECSPKYKLSIEWPAGEWIAWKKLKETINAPDVDGNLPDFMLEGDFEFSDWSGNLHVGFYSSDRSVIEQRFIDGNNEVKIRCKVEAFLPGNTGALATALFSVDFVSEDVVASCGDNKLSLSDTTHANVERPDIPVY
jgi:hypothetical protein